MILKNIKIEFLRQSSTNTKGRNEGKSFDELVASIKEKGVLMPILVRVIPDKKEIYEVIAGNRRFQASKEAGLKEVPAQIVEMTDVEAREAQIVENLQRDDIHPLDEGESYRKLIESSSPKYGMGDVAIKVGKSESYIKQRLALTNLIDRAKKALRDNKITLGQAVMVARIGNETIQGKALYQAKEMGQSGSRLAEWIMEATYQESSLRKPWLKDKKLAEAVGDIQNKQSLFDDKSLGFDPVAYGEQMARFIDIKIKEWEDKGEKMVKISTDYGHPMVRDYTATLKKYTDENGSDGKLKIIFALLIPTPSPDYIEHFNKAVKKL